MWRQRSRGRLVALATAAALVVAACGGDDDTSTSDSVDDGDAAVEEPADAPAATDAPDTTEAPDASDAPDATDAPDAPAGDLEPLKISLSLPATGPLGPNGAGNKAGFEFYFEQNGGTAGGRPVEIISSDSQGAPDVAVQEAQKAIERDGVDVLAGYVSSAAALAVRDLAVRAEVPLVVTQAATSKLVAEDDPASQWVTQAIATFDSTFVPLTEQAIADGATNIVFMGSDYEAGYDAAGATEAAAEANGATIVESIFAPLGTQDFAPLFGSVPDDVDAVIAFFGGTDAVRFVEQYNDFGLAGEVPLYSHWALTIEPLLEQMAPESAAGIVTLQEYSRSLDNPANSDFIAAWTEATGEPPNAWNEQGYVAAMAIDVALANDPTLEGAALAEAIHAVQLDAPRGSVTFTTSGRVQAPFYQAVVEETDAGLANIISGELG